MSTAELIAMELTKEPHAACTLKGGYAVMYNGDRRQFPTGRTLVENRNKDGRVTKLIVEYDDGSQLRFQWCPVHGANYTVLEE